MSSTSRITTIATAAVMFMAAQGAHAAPKPPAMKGQTYANRLPYLQEGQTACKRERVQVKIKTQCSTICTGTMKFGNKVVPMNSCRIYYYPENKMWNFSASGNGASGTGSTNGSVYGTLSSDGKTIEVNQAYYSSYSTNGQVVKNYGQGTLK